MLIYKEIIKQEDSNMKDSNYLTPKDVMKRYQIKRNKTYELFNKLDFPSFKIGKNYLVKEEDLLEWENSLKN
jgi:predicted DNA-binding transcriptional regulator AlpA